MASIKAQQTQLYCMKKKICQRFTDLKRGKRWWCGPVHVRRRTEKGGIRGAAVHAYHALRLRPWTGGGGTRRAVRAVATS